MYPVGIFAEQTDEDTPMTTNTMQAVRIHRYGGPDVMQLDELPRPEPGSGQVRVRIEAASVNFIDIVHRRGDLATHAFYSGEAGLKEAFPFTLGSQGVGVVEALGPGAEGVAVGQRVNVYGSTYATHVVVGADRLIPVPPGLTLEQAAAGLGQGFIAYELTHLAYPVQPGDWVLVHAAAGGVGLLLCQMAALRGGRVIGVASSAAKAEAARAAGAEAVINSTTDDIAAEARRLTGGRGVQVVYDGVGKDTFEASLNSLAPRGYLMVYGQASGFVPPFDIMTLQDKGSLFISRNSAAFYREAFPEYLATFVNWVQQGKLTVRVERTYPLAQAAEAQAAVEQRTAIGRVLLVP
jgi:NADPH2:quinone reductase